MDEDRPPESLTAVLEQLQAGRTLDEHNYAALSDLSRSDAEQVRAAWPAIPVHAREETISRASTLAEDRIDLDFVALAHVALDDPEASVRMGALEALGDSTSRSAGVRLARMLADDADNHVRAAVATVLRQFVLALEFGQFPGQEGGLIVAALRSRLDDHDEDLLVRSLALEALGPHTGAWMVRAIEHAYASDDRDMRLAALRAMADSCDDRWVDYLFEQVTSDDAEFRFEAAVAAGAIGSSDAIEPLVQLLFDEDPRVADAAVEALGEIGGSSAVEELRAFAPQAPEDMAPAIERAISAASEIAALEDAEDDD